MKNPLNFRVFFHFFSSNGSFDEMEMDDLFEKTLDEEGDGESEDNMENGGTGEIEGKLLF